MANIEKKISIHRLHLKSNVFKPFVIFITTKGLNERQIWIDINRMITNKKALLREGFHVDNVNFLFD